MQGPPKLTQIGIFGLKICHLSTLVKMDICRFKSVKADLHALAERQGPVEVHLVGVDERVAQVGVPFADFLWQKSYSIFDLALAVKEVAILQSSIYELLSYPPPPQKKSPAKQFLNKFSHMINRQSKLKRT
jgi:hypothetical protein